MLSKVLFFLITLIVIGNLYTSYRVFKSCDYEKNQKMYQLVIIWALPFIGIFLVLFFLDQGSSTNTYYSDNSGAETGYSDSCSGEACD